MTISQAGHNSNKTYIQCHEKHNRISNSSAKPKPYRQNHYTLNDTDVVVVNGVITHCSYNFSQNADGTDLSIPSILDTQTVTTIGEGVFSSRNLQSITLPNTLTTIKRSAFSGNFIRALTLPASIKHIELNAFNWGSLVSLTFEENSNLMSISRLALAGNPLMAIRLPNHANPNFTEYVDGHGNSYNENVVYQDFTVGIFANIPYTLTDEDVRVIDGRITECTYNMDSTRNMQ